MSVRALIFDLDGTLVDSLGDIGAAMNHALADYRRFVGDGVEMLARRAAPPGPDAEARRIELIAAYQRAYASHLFDATHPYPGILELLEELRARRVPLAVLSNKPDEPTRRLCEALFPADTFVAVQGALPEVPRKPDPGAALALAARLGAPPPAIGFVGDTSVDMLTASAAGMRAIGVAWGFRPDELRDTGAEQVVERPDELLELLLP